MNRRLDFRAATPEDTPGIGALYARLLLDADWLDRDARQPRNFAALSVGELVFVAHSRDDKLAGFVSVYKPLAFIHHLYVAPEWQRQGVASALLSALTPLLPKPWRLKCVRANSAARAFYAANGWVVISEGESSEGTYDLLELRAND